jgi:hypothetical protein
MRSLADAQAIRNNVSPKVANLDTSNLAIELFHRGQVAWIWRRFVKGGAAGMGARPSSVRSPRGLAFFNWARDSAIEYSNAEDSF